MEFPKFLPRHGNHCTICESLDYELDPTQDHLSDKTFIKKHPEIVRKPFVLSSVPSHILETILTKMHYNAFTKLRRSNKEFYEYIGSRRKNLRIAMFHDRSLHILKIRNESLISFSNYKCPYIINKSPEYLHLSEVRPFANGMISKEISLGPEFITIDNKTRYCRADQIKLRCNGFETNVDLIREFTGVYKPYLVYPATDIANCNSITHFLQWARIKKVTLIASFLPASEFLRACKILEPSSLDLMEIFDLPKDFLQDECFKETRALDFYAEEDNFDFNPCNLRAFYAAANVKNSYLIKVLQAWINGETKVEEMWLPIKGTASINQFSPLQISDVTTSHQFKKIRNMRVCVLEQAKTGKKAFCAINRQKTGLGTRDVVYFKCV